jgi:hypothetical protein
VKNISGRSGGRDREKTDKTAIHNRLKHKKRPCPYGHGPFFYRLISPEILLQPGIRLIQVLEPGTAILPETYCPESPLEDIVRCILTDGSPAAPARTYG